MRHRHRPSLPARGCPHSALPSGRTPRTTDSGTGLIAHDVLGRATDARLRSWRRRGACSRSYPEAVGGPSHLIDVAGTRQFFDPPWLGPPKKAPLSEAEKTIGLRRLARVLHPHQTSPPHPRTRQVDLTRQVLLA